MLQLSQLAEICSQNGLELTKAQLDQLETYASLLKEWNAKVNLISRKDEDNILSKHVLHSLTLAMPKVAEIPHAADVLDLGTGGGLPGIPLKIARPDLLILLSDSIAKKIAACRDIVTRLGLIGIMTDLGRAEDLAKDQELREGFKTIVSRAVAPLDELAKWSQGVVQRGGTLYSLKGGDLSEEISRTKKLSFVASVEDRPLQLVGYDEFEKDEKKIVRVELK